MAHARTGSRVGCLELAPSSQAFRTVHWPEASSAISSFVKLRRQRARGDELSKNFRHTSTLDRTCDGPATAFASAAGTSTDRLQAAVCAAARRHFRPDLRRLRRGCRVILACPLSSSVVCKAAAQAPDSPRIFVCARRQFATTIVRAGHRNQTAFLSVNVVATVRVDFQWPFRGFRAALAPEASRGALCVSGCGRRFVLPFVHRAEPSRGLLCAGVCVAKSRRCPCSCLSVSMASTGAVPGRNASHGGPTRPKAGNRQCARRGQAPSRRLVFWASPAGCKIVESRVVQMPVTLFVVPVLLAHVPTLGGCGQWAASSATSISTASQSETDPSGGALGLGEL